MKSATSPAKSQVMIDNLTSLNIKERLKKAQKQLTFEGLSLTFKTERIESD